MISDGSNPKSEGVETTPGILLVESTKSMILQSSLPVSGDSRMPRPICRACIRVNLLQRVLSIHHLSEDISRTCWASNDNAIDIRNIRTLRQYGLMAFQKLEA